MKHFYTTTVISVLLCTLSIMTACSKDGDVEETPPPPVEEDKHVNPDENKRADLAFESYNRVFLVDKNGRQYYRQTLKGGDEKDWFWGQALDIQMAEDVYLRTKNRSHSQLIEQLLTTFIKDNHDISQGGGEWGWNDFQDDILWAGLAFARGYQITQNEVFLEKAAYAFELAYTRGYDEVLGGGLWWRTLWVPEDGDKHKSSLSNNPAVILACYLYEFTGKEEYLTKATSIFEWVLARLYDENSGGVYEDISFKGVPKGLGNVYSNGAFIGAATALHRLTGEERYYNVALKASDYVVSERTNNDKIMSRAWRQGTWQSEYCRGLGEFLRDNNKSNSYYAWLKKNADASWSMRRTDLNVVWNDWTQVMPADDEASALECVGGVIIQQIVSSNSPELKTSVSYQIRPKSDRTKALNAVSAGATDGTAINVIERKGVLHQQFDIVSKGQGYYQITPKHTKGYVLTTDGTKLILKTAADGNENQYWKIVYDYQGYYKLKSKSAPLLCLTMNGDQCALVKEANVDKERWEFTSIAE